VDGTPHSRLYTTKNGLHVSTHLRLAGLLHADTFPHFLEPPPTTTLYLYKRLPPVENFYHSQRSGRLNCAATPFCAPAKTHIPASPLRTGLHCRTTAPVGPAPPPCPHGSYSCRCGLGFARRTWADFMPTIFSLPSTQTRGAHTFAHHGQHSQTACPFLLHHPNTTALPTCNTRLGRTHLPSFAPHPTHAPPHYLRSVSLAPFLHAAAAAYHATLATGAGGSTLPRLAPATLPPPLNRHMPTPATLPGQTWDRPPHTFQGRALGYYWF